MWDDFQSDGTKTANDAEINAKYAKRELRIVTETNREQLPTAPSPSWIGQAPLRNSHGARLLTHVLDFKAMAERSSPRGSNR